MITRAALIAMYLDWRNNFLTVERFAEYYGIDEDKAERVIFLGRKLAMIELR